MNSHISLSHTLCNAACHLLLPLLHNTLPVSFTLALYSWQFPSVLGLVHMCALYYLAKHNFLSAPSEVQNKDSINLNDWSPCFRGTHAKQQLEPMMVLYLHTFLPSLCFKFKNLSVNTDNPLLWFLMTLYPAIGPSLFDHLKSILTSYICMTVTLQLPAVLFWCWSRWRVSTTTWQSTDNDFAWELRSNGWRVTDRMLFAVAVHHEQRGGSHSTFGFWFPPSITPQLRVSICRSGLFFCLFPHLR